MAIYEIGNQKIVTLRELGGKEIVNLNTGGRLGIIADSDILIDEKTGKIHSLLVPDNRNQFKFFGEKRELNIPWNTIRRIGDDMIIIELQY
ncbi:YlmC/YmxH family sporulation protein [Clostridium sp. D2Q-11]|uniref:YlmC/YmxH family sporulation protein n=1 Tax=Anaeromonas frigoriresistens TaxID=2683708 RepID=A0A942ZAL9_9FIRM|nr:YlmC/YmxH family sporulation protein [Anaeromonas frigoriresistens]MBS4539900.1 YlmC/YmxH family sporulation protein [Anaeromonas frigoriresistens]